MAVIIDTLEVVSDSEGASEALPSPEAEKAGLSNAPRLSPADIESIIEHQQQRLERVRAH